MTTAKNFSELREKMTPERRAQNKAGTDALLEHLDAEKPRDYDTCEITRHAPDTPPVADDPSLGPSEDPGEAG